MSELLNGRKVYWCDGIDDGSVSRDLIEEVGVMGSKDLDPYNLISSRVDKEQHKPAIDLDMPCLLVNSTTPGHHHLYIDKELTAEQYRKLLTVMVEVGLVEKGILMRFDRSGMTCLRPPGYKKPEGYTCSSGEEEQETNG